MNEDVEMETPLSHDWLDTIISGFLLNECFRLMAWTGVSLGLS